MVESFTDKVMHDRQLPGLKPGDTLLGRLLGIVEAQPWDQRDDEWLARSPGVTHRIGQGGGHRAHLDPFALFPRRRRGLTGPEDY